MTHKKLELFLLSFMLFYSTSNAVTIKKIPNLQLAGLHLFVASTNTSDSIKWQVDQFTVDENSGAYQYTPNVFSAAGDTVKVILIKYAGKYSYYKIFADDGISKDSITVQVFNKGVPQKYYFSNEDEPSKPIVVYIVLPPSLSINSKFVMVMHGTNRNADDYITAWRDFANNNDYVVAAPEFTDADWPHSRSYNLGNVFTGTDGSGSLNHKYKWAFSVVCNIHSELADRLELVEKRYDIWGHSAGSQFVHRMMEFLPDENIRFYISANAGWYTLPDLDINYPYGFRHDDLNFVFSDLDRMNKENMIIMRGTADTVRDNNLRTTPEADAQGLNRYERAYTFYTVGFDISDAEKWQLIDVPDVGHDFELMAPAAQQFLIDNPITSVKASFTSMPSNLILYQNYPNPFNPSTKIQYTIPLVERKSSFAQSPRGIKRSQSGDWLYNVTLKVYDILGREVTTLVNERQQPGNYTVEFNASNLTSGVYFYTLRVGNNILSKKLILLK